MATEPELVEDEEPPLPVGLAERAEEYERLANTPLSTNDPGLMWAMLAIACELRLLRRALSDDSERV